MSNLTYFTQFLDWVKKLPKDIHLGEEICAKASSLKFLRFFINRPVLYLFVRIFIKDEKRPFEGFIFAMTIEPENNLFSIQVSNEFMRTPVIREIPLDKLESLEQLSTDDLVQRKQSVISMKSKLFNLAKTSISRRPKWNCTSVNHPGSAYQI